MELLFESRINVLDPERRLRFVQVKPTIHPDPVVCPDTFADGSWTSIYGTVLRDGGKLRMWYQAVPRDWDWLADSARVGYAESDDGMHWVKPKFDFVKCGPGPNNLLNMTLHTPTVFIDPDSPPSHRYRATGCAYPQLNGNPKVTQAGYYTAHSSDGLNWELDESGPRWHSADNIYSVYHPQRRCAQITMKFCPRVGRMVRRSWHMAEFRDGTYSDDVPVLYPDEFDDVVALNRGYRSCDYYAFTMMPAGMGTVGFILKFLHEMPYTFGDQCGALYGVPEVGLVYQSTPGARWLHVPGRPAFIEAKGQPWLDGWFSCSSCPVEVGDEHWLYLSGRNRSHGFGRNPSWGLVDRWIDWAKANNHNGIGFARWPKWRLFGFESDPDGAFVLDLGPVDRPSELVLNYKTKADGFVRVALAQGPKKFCNLNGVWAGQTAIPGRSMDDCVTLEGDSTGKVVAWKEGTIIAPSNGNHVFAKIDMGVAGVYAYEVRPRSHIAT